MALSHDEILAAVVDVMVNEADVPEEEISLEKSFVDDLNLDSITIMEITSALEEKLDITIEDEQATELNTVGDVVELVKTLA